MAVRSLADLDQEIAKAIYAVQQAKDKGDLLARQVALSSLRLERELLCMTDMLGNLTEAVRKLKH
jgi:hypothetical protein